LSCGAWIAFPGTEKTCCETEGGLPAECPRLFLILLPWPAAQRTGSLGRTSPPGTKPVVATLARPRLRAASKTLISTKFAPETNEKAELRLFVGQQFVAWSRALLTGIVSVKLELPSSSGVTLGDIKYPRTQKHQLAFGQRKLALNRVHGFVFNVAKASFAAAIVFWTSSSEWAVLRKAASYCDGGK
jgi:hypothetical protein